MKEKDENKDVRSYSESDYEDAMEEVCNVFTDTIKKLRETRNNIVCMDPIVCATKAVIENMTSDYDRRCMMETMGFVHKDDVVQYVCDNGLAKKVVDEMDYWDLKSALSESDMLEELIDDCSYDDDDAIECIDDPETLLRRFVELEGTGVMDKNGILKCVSEWLDFNYKRIWA